MLQSKKLLENLKLSEDRCKQKNRESTRSRSVEPYLGRRHPITLMTQSYPPAGVRTTTEYRSQFAWPSANDVIAHDRTRRESAKAPKPPTPPRKSVSMGIIQSANKPSMIRATSAHIKDGGDEAECLKSPVNEQMTRSLEEQILVGRTNDDGPADHLEASGSKPKKFKTEYKSRFKAPMKYIYVGGAWKKPKETPPPQQQVKKAAAVESKKIAADETLTWYSEVMELRKKAGEYKCRSWASSMAPDHLAEIYNRQKDVWDQVSRRSSLSALALAATPSPVCGAPPKGLPDGGRGRVPTRHHLERTTPATGLGRSASVGPEGRLQKHTPRTASASTSRSHTADAHADDSAKHTTAKRPRPNSLATSASRPRSVARVHDAVDGDALAKPHRLRSAGVPRSGGTVPSSAQTKREKALQGEADKVKDKKVNKEDKENVINGDGLASDLASPESIPSKISDYAPIVKSPPEPTRVKSPEQIIVKSPEPVKWTVPLETGIKWTETPQADGDCASSRSKMSPVVGPKPLPGEGGLNGTDCILHDED